MDKRMKKFLNRMPGTKTPPSVNCFIYIYITRDLKTSFEHKIGSIRSDQKSERFVHLETGYVRSRDRGGWGREGGRERERDSIYTEESKFPLRGEIEANHLTKHSSHSAFHQLNKFDKNRRRGQGINPSYSRFNFLPPSLIRPHRRDREEGVGISRKICKGEGWNCKIGRNKYAVQRIEKGNKLRYLLFL